MWAVDIILAMMIIRIPYLFALLLTLLPIDLFAIAPEDYDKTMDGVAIEAIEHYPNFNNQEYKFGVSLFPFNPYYNGLGVNAGYSYGYNKSLIWDVISVSYVFTVNKGLSSELAEDFGVNPKLIEKLKYVVSSDCRYVHSFGKTIFLEKYIQSYRSSFLLGLANATTSLESNIALHFGFHFDFYISDRYSWKIELSDYVTIPSGNFEDFNYISLKLMTGVRF